MTDQKPLTASELKDVFDQALKTRREEAVKNGSAAILRALSEAVKAQQEAGADVGITVRGGAHTNAYDMVYTVGGSHGGTVDFYGVIASGAGRYLFAVASRFNGKDVQHLYVSKFNAEAEGGRFGKDSNNAKSQTLITADCFDFGTDAEALRKFQKRLAELCAENAIAAENDPAGVFNKGTPGGTLPKTLVRLKI
jgi:hypothetical protein